MVTASGIFGGALQIAQGGTSGSFLAQVNIMASWLYLRVELYLNLMQKYVLKLRLLRYPHLL